MMKYLAIIACLISLPAFAQDAPAVPSHHPTQQVERDKKYAEGKKKDLEKQAKQIEVELGSTQKTLVDNAEQIKANEASLNKLDKRIAENRKEQDVINARLKKDKNSIGDLVLALERLDRTPPEAVLARPGAPLETAQSAMLLQSILPNIYGRAESLKKDLNRLNELLTDLQIDQDQVKKTSAELAERQKEIAELLKKRKGLYAKTQTDMKEQDASLREIAARAKNLQDLVSKVEQHEEQRTRTTQNAAINQAHFSDEPRRAAIPTPIPRSGSAQLPVSGLIRTGYGQTDDIGAVSQGLTIEGRPSGLVVSPMGGVVRYAGYFKNYGEIIIVEHQKDYHSLIAGLARIDTVVGQSVAAGEPVGTLSKTSSDGGKPTLYYELRLNGAPVNPARKFAGL